MDVAPVGGAGGGRPARPGVHGPRFLLVFKWLPESPWFETKGQEPKERSAEVGRNRTAILALLAGLIAVTGAIFTGLSYGLNQSGQITERFTRAVDQLGNDKLNVRLGGIYALERIAHDSRDDHPQVMEVLTAYVREHAPWPQESTTAAEGSELLTGLIEAIRALERVAKGGETDSTAAATAPTPRRGDNPVEIPGPWPQRHRLADVQAAMTVLGRRNAAHDVAPLDLANTDLRYLALNWGWGSGHGHEANLQGADLRRSNLNEARLAGANLQGAILYKTILSGALLPKANLQGAVFTLTKLDGAYLKGANLQAAESPPNPHELNDRNNLRSADLEGASYDDDTTWPDGLRTPETTFDYEAATARRSQDPPAAAEFWTTSKCGLTSGRCRSLETALAATESIRAAQTLTASTLRLTRWTGGGATTSRTGERLSGLRRGRRGWVNPTPRVSRRTASRGRS